MSLAFLDSYGSRVLSVSFVLVIRGRLAGTMYQESGSAQVHQDRLKALARVRRVKVMLYPNDWHLLLNQTVEVLSVRQVIGET